MVSPVPELSFLPAPYMGWIRRGKREDNLQDNLHAKCTERTNQKLLGPNHACRVIESRNAFFSSCSEKENIFFDVDIVVKKA